MEKSKYSPLRTPEERHAFWFNPAGERRCSSCKEFKDTSLFSKDKGGPGGLSYVCKSCVRIGHARLYSDKNRYDKKKNIDNENYYKRQYGITKSDKQAMLEAQGSCCAICKKPHPRMHIDHNHATGKIRGILCTNCNRGIGHLQEDITTLKNAIAYLRHHNEDVGIVSEVSCP